MHSIRRLAAALAAALVLAAPAGAGTYFALRADATELWRIDTVSFQATLVGKYDLADKNDVAMSGIAQNAAGEVYGVSFGPFSGSLYRFDTSTGAADDLHAFQAPTSSEGIEFHPATGELYWLNVGGFNPAPQIHSVDVSTFAVSFHGNIGTFAEHFAGMAFAPDGTMYGLELGSHALWVIDLTNPQGPGTFQVGALGAQVDLKGGGALVWDKTLGTLVGYAANTHNLFTVDATTGAATQIHAFPAGVPVFSSVAGGNCGGALVPYGQGCPGSGGLTPALGASGCSNVGGTVTFEVTDGLPFSSAIFVFGLVPAQVPMGGSCSLLLSPLLAPMFATPLNSQGEISFSATLPAGLSGVSFTMQAFVPDGAGDIGASATNGLQVIVD